jgi:hypothetical protein
MAGADAVFKAALGRSKAGSSFRGSRTTRRGTVGSGMLNPLKYGVGTAPNTHMVSGGTTGIPRFPNSTNQGRTFQTFGKK